MPEQISPKELSPPKPGVPTPPAMLMSLAKTWQGPRSFQWPERKMNGTDSVAFLDYLGQCTVHIEDRCQAQGGWDGDKRNVDFVLEKAIQQMLLGKEPDDVARLALPETPFLERIQAVALTEDGYLLYFLEDGDGWATYNDDGEVCDSWEGGLKTGPDVGVGVKVYECNWMAEDKEECLPAMLWVFANTGIQHHDGKYQVVDDCLVVSAEVESISEAVRIALNPNR